MRSKVDQKRLLALMPAFFALTYVLHGQIFAYETQTLPKVNSVPVAQSSSSEANRQPASIPVSDASVLELDCTQTGSLDHSLNKRYMRIVGKKCAANTRVLADTFGYSPQIFWTGKSRFSTELIHLKKGDNAFRISVGEKEHFFSVTRQ